MIKAAFGQNFDQVVRRVFPFVDRIRTRPDRLTLLGVAVSAGAAVAFANHWTLGAGLLLMLAGFFDLIDGVVARQQGVASAAGGFLDSTMDRVSDLLVLGGIAVAMASTPGREVWGTALVCWAMTGSVMTSYTRAKAEAQLGESLAVGLIERGERTVALILGALSGFLLLALWFVAIGSTVTTVQRIIVARRRLDDRETASARREPMADGVPMTEGAGVTRTEERLQDAG